MSIVTFQALTWELQDKNPAKLPSHFRGTEATEKKLYRQCTQVIHVCGRTATGESVRVAVLDHRPVFYCRISEDRFRTAIINASTGFGSYKKTYDTWWVEGVEEVQKRIYQGFTNGREDRLLKITAANRNVMRAMVNELKDFETFDTRLDVISSFFHRTSIKPCGWINIKDCIAIDEEKPPFGYNISACDHDYMCLTSHMEPLQSSEIAPFSVMSIDIEAFCPPNGDGTYPFPDGTVHNHKISTICLRYRCLGERANQDGTMSDGLEHVYFSYRKAHTETIGNICEEEGLCLNTAASYQADTEKEMLVRFLDYFRQRQPDIITGWNTLNFDMKYVFHRCTYYNLRLEDVGKYEVWKTKLQKKNLSTAGAGNNEFQYFDITGVFQMDELVVVRRNMKMDSYSLNFVASEIIGDQKRDEPPSEIHRKSAGTDVELAEIIGYCIKDAALPDEIAKKLQDYVKSMMFANIAMVPIDYLLIRGANIKTYSLIADEVHRRNLVVSDKHRMFNQLDGKYAGATVLDALAGLYTDPVATLDFKSLYPSIIISQQLDPHTFVEDEQYLGLPGVEYKRFCWADEKTRKQYNFVIVTNGAELGCSPLIPDVMERLWSERDSAKKRMKKATTPFEKSVHDGTQLAIKLMMNSIYGFLGAGDASPLPHLPIAMLTTKVGRDMIHETQRFVLAKYGTFDNGSTLEERLKMSKDELEEGCGESVVNVYGDTDSVFIKWSIPSEIRAKGDPSILEYAFKLSELAAEETTQHLNETMCPRKGIVELEFEKVYYYLILYSKKRYAGLMWTNLNKYDKIDCKGIQVVRRDNPLFVRKLLKKSLHSILVERDIDKCKQYICDSLESIVSGTVDIEDLTKSAKLKPDGYEGTPPAHAEVARRLRDRGLPVPDRVPYVFIVADGKVLKDRAEDPSYVLEHPEIQIDYVYYLTNQITTPLMDVLSPAVSGLEKLINTYVERMRKKQRPAEREIEQKKKKMRSIESFFTPLK
jgi:DNA polymerase delta subunit 1